MAIHSSRVVAWVSVSGAMILFLNLSWNGLDRYLLLERLWSTKAAGDLDFVGAIHLLKHIIISRLFVFDHDLYPWDGLLDIITILHTVSLDVQLDLNLVSATWLVPDLDNLLLLLGSSEFYLGLLTLPNLIVLFNLYVWLGNCFPGMIVEALVHHGVLVSECFNFDVGFAWFRSGVVGVHALFLLTERSVIAVETELGHVGLVFQGNVSMATGGEHAASVALPWVSLDEVAVLTWLIKLIRRLVLDELLQVLERICVLF